jgi:hypothetical protein
VGKDYCPKHNCEYSSYYDCPYCQQEELEEEREKKEDDEEE